MFIDCWLYSKTCLKPPLKKEDHYRLMQVKSITECSKGEHSAILSTFIKLPFVIKIFVLSFLSGGFTVLTTYMYFLFCGVCRLTDKWILLLKWDFFATKKDGPTWPTALESDGPYYEIMGQWLGAHHKSERRHLLTLLQTDQTQICLIRVYSVCLWKYDVSDPTLVNLTSNFFVLYTIGPVKQNFWG